MPRYRVYLQTVASTSIDVEAEDKDEAYGNATDSAMPTICAHCSGWGSDQNLDLNDVWEIPNDDVENFVEEISS